MISGSANPNSFIVGKPSWLSDNKGLPPSLVKSRSKGLGLFFFVNHVESWGHPDTLKALKRLCSFRKWCVAQVKELNHDLFHLFREVTESRNGRQNENGWASAKAKKRAKKSSRHFSFPTLCHTNRLLPLSLTSFPGKGKVRSHENKKVRALMPEKEAFCWLECNIIYAWLSTFPCPPHMSSVLRFPYHDKLFLFHFSHHEKPFCAFGKDFNGITKAGNECLASHE